MTFRPGDSNPKGWLRLADETPRVRGLMYTPWERKYALLPAFGDLLDKLPGGE